MGKRHGFLVGEPQHLLPTSLAQTPLSYPGRIVLHMQPQGLGDIQKPCHHIAYLLVWVENAMKDRHYGISIVWVIHNQVRAATMEEAVEKLAACTSSGTDLPYTPSMAVWGPLPCTTPQGWAPGHPTSERGRGDPLWTDQPTQGPPTPCHQPTSHLSCRFEWAWWAHYNQQCKPYHKQTYLLGDWYPFTPSGGTRPKDTTSWQGLHHADN